MALTHIKIQNAKPKEKADQQGLYLHITIKGQKYWRFDYRLGGK